MPATNAVAIDLQPIPTAMVWIEDGEGRISRGLAEELTDRGARVRFTGEPGFDQGDQVHLRICLEPGAPTVATTARVSWVRTRGSAVECGLEWAPFACGGGLPSVP